MGRRAINNYYCKISGTISQEICPAGLSEENVQVDWGRFLEAAGHYHAAQTGESLGMTIKGEIYVTGYEGGYEGWICLEGMEPIKVLLDNGT